MLRGASIAAGSALKSQSDIAIRHLFRGRAGGNPGLLAQA
jgi:hypothetical protein